MQKCVVCVCVWQNSNGGKQVRVRVRSIFSLGIFASFDFCFFQILTALLFVCTFFSFLFVRFAHLPVKHRLCVNARRSILLFDTLKNLFSPKFLLVCESE